MALPTWMDPLFQEEVVSALKTMEITQGLIVFNTDGRRGIIRTSPLKWMDPKSKASRDQLAISLALAFRQDPDEGVMNIQEAVTAWICRSITKTILSFDEEMRDFTWPDGDIAFYALYPDALGVENPQVPNCLLVEYTEDGEITNSVIHPLRLGVPA